MKNIYRKIGAVFLIAYFFLCNISCNNMMSNTETMGILEPNTNEETSGVKIASHVAVLIANGKLAERNIDINLYRVEVAQDSPNIWKV